MFARFPFGACDHPDTTDWMIQTVIKAKSDPRIDKVLHTREDGTPITMKRNLVCKRALQQGADFLLMLDSDMAPDMLVGRDPTAKPFWDTSLTFLIEHRKPAVIAAPYCGPPPWENMFVFKFANRQSDHPNVDIIIDQFTREEGAQRAGIEEVAALPTGLILIDVRALRSIWDASKKPWFDYEYKDAECSELATTEDVFFSRNLNLAGVPQFCNWDSWAGHWKRKKVGKPVLLTSDAVREGYKEAILRGTRSDERLVMIGEEAGLNNRLRQEFERQEGMQATDQDLEAMESAAKQRRDEVPGDLR